MDHAELSLMERRMMINYILSKKLTTRHHSSSLTFLLKRIPKLQLKIYRLEVSYLRK